MRRRFRRSSRDQASEHVTSPEGSGDGGHPGPLGDGPEGEGAEPSFDALLARQLDRVDGVVDRFDADPTGSARPDPAETGAERPTTASERSENLAGAEVEPESVGTTRTLVPPDRATTGDRDFWDHHDRAEAEAKLAGTPPAAVVAVVGPLEAALPVVRRCRDRHWMGGCDVFVLTRHPVVPGEPDWTVVGQPSDLVAALGDGSSDFPLLVLDVPCDLPAFVRPLVARLRDNGVGLVHYVLDGDPVDEDLATWHGELGQPSVLDLAGPVPPGRVLDLFDRGEPVVSVSGLDLSAELLLALRIDEMVDRSG